MEHIINKSEFYQSKYDFFKIFCIAVVVVSCLASTTYFISDCQLFGRFATETLLPRMNILIPMTAFIFLSKKCNHYKVMTLASYVILHWIMWNTIWAIYYLPDRTHASEGFIIMHIMFFAVGFCAPFSYALIAHVLLIADILVSNSFNHYENLDIMLSLGIPVMCGICASQYVMQKLYRVHYEMTEKLRRISYYDALTEVYNRNILGSLLQEDGTHFRTELGEEVCILLFDVDLFKSVNDTYGHVQGDIVLKEMAHLVSSRISDKDIMIRWGGEEFIIILKDTSKEQGMTFAEKIRKLVEAQDNGVCRITVSIGVSMYRGTDYKAAISAADRALYKAKNNGRNRVEYQDCRAETDTV